MADDLLRALDLQIRRSGAARRDRRIRCHETAAAGYGWNVVSHAVGGTYDIVRPADELQPVLLQAWMSREAAVGLFAKAGLDFEVLKRQARDPNFRPVEIGDARFSIDMVVKTERVESRNVLAKLSRTILHSPRPRKVAQSRQMRGRSAACSIAPTTSRSPNAAFLRCC